MDSWRDLADEAGEDLVRRVLMHANASRAVGEFDRCMAVDFAARLWQQRVEKRAIVDRLVSRYQFSKATGYRLADEGLEKFSRSRGQ